MTDDLERQLRSTLNFVRDAHTETFVSDLPAIKRDVLERARRRSPLPRWQWAGAVATAAAVIIAVVVIVTGGDDVRITPTPDVPDMGGRAGPEIEESFDLGASPSTLAVAGDALYVGNAERNTVVKVDRRTGRRVARGPVDHPVGMAAGEGAVWVVSDTGTRWTLSKLTPHRLAATKAIELDPPLNVAAGGGTVWTTSPGELSRIDPRAVRIVESFPIADARDLAVAPDGSSVWLATARSIERLDPSTGAASLTIELNRDVTAIAVTDTDLWVISTAPDGSFGELNAFDVRTGTKQHASLPLARGPFDMAYGRGSLWIGRAGATDVIRVIAVTDFRL